MKNFKLFLCAIVLVSSCNLYGMRPEKAKDSAASREDASEESKGPKGLDGSAYGVLLCKMVAVFEQYQKNTQESFEEIVRNPKKDYEYFLRTCAATRGSHSSRWFIDILHKWARDARVDLLSTAFNEYRSLAVEACKNSLGETLLDSARKAPESSKKELCIKYLEHLAEQDELLGVVHCNHDEPDSLIVMFDSVHFLD